MSDKTIRAKARVKNGLIDVKLLIKHPMETGLRKNREGGLIPAKFIQQVVATSNGRPVFNAQLNTAVSKDPYLGFSFAGSPSNDVLISWVDSQGDRDELRVSVK